MRRAAETLDELGVGYDAQHRLRPSHPRPAGRLRQGRTGGGLQGDHRRRRRRRASARHDRGLHPAAGVRRAHRHQGAFGTGQPAVDRPDAGRRAGGDAGHRRGGRGQRGAAGRRGAGARRSARSPAGSTPGAPRTRGRWPTGRPTRAPARDDPRPGATIGILGAGQLGRMLAMAAARLGLRSHVFAPEAEAPAFDVASARTIGAYDDEAALALVRRGGRRRHLRIRERADATASIFLRPGGRCARRAGACGHPGPARPKRRS